MNTRRLTKSLTDSSLHGVCGGIAEFFGISSFLVRLIFIMTPASLIVYILLANMLPDGQLQLYSKY